MIELAMKLAFADKKIVVEVTYIIWTVLDLVVDVLILTFLKAILALRQS